MSLSDSLRQQAKWIDMATATDGSSDFDLGDVDTDELRDAADEIERLRAALIRINSRHTAEIERLRALLDEVRNATAMPLPDPGAHSWRAFYDAACTRLTRCASAARRAHQQTTAGEKS